jgi:multiple sugar transport system ATP-binding protein
MNLIERGEVLVGFRPEQFVPRQAAKAGNELQSFTFHISRVEYLGADQLLYGEVEEGGGETAVIAKLSSEETIPADPGHSYEFVVQEQQIRYFDKATGLRVGPEEGAGP